MNNQRPDWNTTYMDICKVLSKRSTCIRIKTASVIVKDNVIISVGYNGSVSGREHCVDYFTNKYNNDINDNNNIYNYIQKYDKYYKIPSLEEYLQSSKFYNEHHEFACKNELHGETNAILSAGKNGISLQDSNIYTIYSPCINCAKAIVSSGIKKLYYELIYKRDEEGLVFLNKCGIDVIKLNN